MNELSFIDELDETENQFILFVKMVPIIHWSRSPKKMVTKIYNCEQGHVGVTLKNQMTLLVRVLGSS